VLALRPGNTTRHTSDGLVRVAPGALPISPTYTHKTRTRAASQSSRVRGVVSLFSPTGWSFSLYPDAAEGGGTVVTPTRRAPAPVARGQAANPSRAA